MVSRVENRRRWPGRLMQLVFGFGVAALIVAGVIAAGNAARDALGPRDRYLLAFDEIECEGPKDFDRREFLGEVQYNGVFADKVNILDPHLPDQLRDAFAKHRKIERVVEVSVLPPKRIRVKLIWRP